MHSASAILNFSSIKLALTVIDFYAFFRNITKHFLSDWIVCIVRRPYWIFRPSSKLALTPIDSYAFCRKITKHFLSNWIVCKLRRPYWIFRPSSKLARSLQLTFTLGRLKPLPSLAALQSHHFFKPLKSNPFETLPFEKRPLSVHSMFRRI